MKNKEIKWQKEKQELKNKIIILEQKIEEEEKGEKKNNIMHSRFSRWLHF